MANFLEIYEGMKNEKDVDEAVRPETEKTRSALAKTLNNVKRMEARVNNSLEVLLAIHKGNGQVSSEVMKSAQKVHKLSEALEEEIRKVQSLIERDKNSAGIKR